MLIRFSEIANFILRTTWFRARKKKRENSMLPCLLLSLSNTCSNPALCPPVASWFASTFTWFNPCRLSKHQRSDRPAHLQSTPPGSSYNSMNGSQILAQKKVSAFCQRVIQCKVQTHFAICTRHIAGRFPAVMARLSIRRLPPEFLWHQFIRRIWISSSLRFS